MQIDQKHQHAADDGTARAKVVAGRAGPAVVHVARYRHAERNRDGLRELDEAPGAGKVAGPHLLVRVHL